MIRKFTRRAFLILSGKIATAAAFSSTVLSNVRAAIADEGGPPDLDDCGTGEGYGYGYGYGYGSCGEQGFD